MNRKFCLPFTMLVIAWAQGPATAAAEGPLQFNRDIRPILSDNCFRCHGFDKNTREADLRLDTAEAAYAETASGVIPIVPGKPDESEILVRITSEDADLRMPPPDSHQSLNESQVATLRQWIAEGAKYEPHWAFIPVVRPEVPQVDKAEVGSQKAEGSGDSPSPISNLKSQILSPIDAFIAHKLAASGLAFSPPADKATLLRRVTFDLTGLPPTPAEVAAFLNDDSPDAYEKAVDRLLASPRYGEHMAADWLDAARYSDTNGYQADLTRTSWPWRDWVIKALNDNMPFDQFTIEQLAGDMLPNPTNAQLVATGFNRNHPMNNEGGRIPEESRNDYVMDRVETTGTVWLGLTIGCCRCHDHKYDPISQAEYYQLFAYFNNIAETGSVDPSGNTPPVVRVIDAEAEQHLAGLRQKVAEAETAVATEQAAIAAQPPTATEQPTDQPTDAPAKSAAPPPTQIQQALEQARKAVTDYENPLPLTMVMQERSEPAPRDTWILKVGIYTNRGDQVQPGVPAALPPLPADQPNNRLTFARWLVSPQNPLTPRVTVNRYWQRFFGTGLVKTSEDFGVQGELPPQRELLDWLAAEFVSSGWNVKAMHRLIVTSAAYRQSSQVTPQLLERDPDNRLLARGPRFRLPSFAIRDAALANSGLLVEKLGGPPVKPYMAAGVWEDASIGTISYQADKGEGLYRRSIYTFFRRIAAPAQFFDISTRNVCTVRMARTNTPLQALLLMNDVQYVEAARQLALRMLREAGSTPAERIHFAFNLCTSRLPTADEQALLLAALQKFQARFNENPAAAQELTKQGETPLPSDFAPEQTPELAAYTMLASLIFNLDETITKE